MRTLNPAEVAMRQRLVVAAFVVALVVFVLSMGTQAMLMTPWMASLAFAFIAAILLMLSLRLPVVWMVLALVGLLLPVVNLIVLVVLNAHANRVLRNEGYSVGWLGARRVPAA
ncbi:MAG: hypothetical protein ACNA8P_12100 [Phycisphaerales bacterium]